MSGSAVELDALLAAWDVRGLIQAERLIEGTNNLSLDVRTASGRHVLRVYARDAPVRRLRFEHALLMRLHAMSLSFDVPAPIATDSGHTPISTADGRPAALFPFL